MLFPNDVVSDAPIPTLLPLFTIFLHLCYCYTATTSTYELAFCRPTFVTEGLDGKEVSTSSQRSHNVYLVQSLSQL